MAAHRSTRQGTHRPCLRAGLVSRHGLTVTPTVPAPETTTPGGFATLDVTVVDPALSGRKETLAEPEAMGLIVTEAVAPATPPTTSPPTAGLLLVRVTDTGVPLARTFCSACRLVPSAFGIPTCTLKGSSALPATLVAGRPSIRMCAGTMTALMLPSLKRDDDTVMITPPLAFSTPCTK